MKNTLLLIITLLIALTATSQTELPPLIPEDKLAEYTAISSQYRATMQPGIIGIPPLERLPLEPSFLTKNAGGNYAPQFYGVPGNEKWIEQNLKRKVAILIFDTAGKFTSPALKRFIWNKYNRIYTGEEPGDSHGHGSHVASCIAGDHPDGLRLGPATVLGNYLKLIAIDILNKGGYGSTTDIVKAIQDANNVVNELQAQGYFVIYNMSFGANTTNKQFDRVIEQAEDKGVLVFAAAGNSNTDIGTPANGPAAHAVAAIDPNGNRASFSSFGKQQYISGSGYRVFGVWKDTYRELSGTSMASPTVAALAAITAATSNATARQISHYLTDISTDIPPAGWDEKTGWGYSHSDDIVLYEPSIYPDKLNGNPDTQTPDYPDKQKRDGAPDDPSDDPEDDPDEPEDDPEEPGDKRTIEVDLTHEYPVLWKANNTSTWRRTAIVMDVAYTSKLSADIAHDALELGTAAFFTNRAFILRDNDDFAEAGYWVRHFYEMIMGRRGYDVEVTNYWSIDEEGRKVRLDKKRRGKVRFALTRLFSPISSTETFITP